ncbi:sulfate transporter [Desulfuromonas soudanensis]|uniref:Sulfate transporter n=1 Tax=Desulfuromonas soudanensis TaxID=1603606 RepID=A0A0M4DG45_9BACT|nr:SulP family inorganic anion transporter [Desulfuromonas soudanensis]ALC15557.1 sulfate transporter [Desulfuromonas soudanensis]
MKSELSQAPPASFTSPVLAAEILQNIIIGLTVSFVALSLGAALGILSGRGAFVGMFSAGIIAFVCSLLGGTRIQCSGPTAPMGALTATVVSFAYENPPAALSGYNPDHFITLVLLLTGALLMLMAVLRLGKFISLVPNVVISGFMSGIALLIWIGQSQTIFGLGGKRAMEGPIVLNVLVTLSTVALIFLLPGLLRKRVPGLAHYLPATLVAIVLMTLLANGLSLPIAHVSLDGHLGSFADLQSLIHSQWPASWSLALIVAAAPFAIQLSLLCYLDTLLTSLVIDKMTGEPTRQDRELVAQGVANASVALIGGIPGAQATIRSVLLVKENATLRLAGVAAGIFVLVEMILFQDAINLIPKAVFAGVLFKVGYDVFDFRPLRIYCKELTRYRARLITDFFNRHDEEPIFVSNREMLLILGTAAVTIAWNLNVAVAGFTALFYLHNRLLCRGNPIRDLIPAAETEGIFRED